jgi:tetratricopeptide (TPR) repeat protein
MRQAFLLLALAVVGLVSYATCNGQAGAPPATQPAALTERDARWHDYILAGRKAFEAEQYAEAERLFKLAMQLAEQFDAADARLAENLERMADLYRAWEKYDLAEPIYERLLALRDRELDRERRDRERALHSLAVLDRTEARSDAAIARAHDDAAEHEHPDVARIMHNLAELYRAQGKFDVAEPMYQRSLAMREKLLGAEHPEVARSLHSLAELYRAQGKYDAAEPMYQRSLAIREKALGPEHLDVAESLNDLAELHRVRGKYDQAEPMYKRALAIREKQLGPNHPMVADSLDNMVKMYEAQGRHELARPLHERSVAIRSRAAHR